MINQNLLIYDSRTFFDVLSELKDSLNFNVVYISKQEFMTSNLDKYSNYLILTIKDLNIPNQVLSGDVPIKLSHLLEKINIQFLKQRFNKQSKINIGPYIININSKEIILKDLKLKLTEKEVDTIIYLLEKKKPVSISELQSKVWGYQSELETHTVETHIHRLRRKIKEKFNNENFIISSKEGYIIN